MNLRLQSILDQHAASWGMKVTLLEVKQVELAEQMIRAIARQAEAERERRAKVIHAEGEYLAAERLAMTAAVIQQQHNYRISVAGRLDQLDGASAEWLWKEYSNSSPGAVFRCSPSRC